MITLSRFIDEVLVPEYFARPGQSSFKPSNLKERYVEGAAEQSAKLTLRIETWRQKVPSTDDGLKQIEGHGWMDPLWKSTQDQMRRLVRELRDKGNIEDFINGKVEGVNKARYMCWPLDISGRLTAIWFKPRVPYFVIGYDSTVAS